MSGHRASIPKGLSREDEEMVDREEGKFEEAEFDDMSSGADDDDEEDDDEEDEEPDTDGSDLGDDDDSETEDEELFKANEEATKKLKRQGGVLCPVCQMLVLGDDANKFDIGVACIHRSCFYVHHGAGRWGVDGLHIAAPLPLPRSPTDPLLPTLMPELWGIVASFLPPMALCCFARVCKRWKIMADREFSARVQRRTEREMDLYAVSPTKLRIGVPVSEGAFRLYREELKQCGLSRDTLMRQVLLWAADGGQLCFMRSLHKTPAYRVYFQKHASEILERAAASNEAGVIIFMLTEECYRSPSVSYHKAWCAAARGGSVPLMELFEHFPSLSKTIANKDSAMAGVAVVPVFSRTKEAAFGGQTSLCSALMKRFNVEKNISAWNSVLREAASGGHVQLIEMALQNGATDVQKALDLAVQYGRGQLMERLLARGAKVLAGTLDSAAYGGQAALVAECLRRLKPLKDYSVAVGSAATEGNDAVLQLLSEFPAAQAISNWEGALAAACSAGNLSTVQWLLTRFEGQAPPLTDRRVNDCLLNAYGNGFKRIEELLRAYQRKHLPTVAKRVPDVKKR